MKNPMKLIPRVGTLVILAAFISGAGPIQKEKAVEQPKSAQPVTVVDPRDPKSILYLDSKGNLAGTGDVTKSGVASEAAKAGAGWHPAALAAIIVPKDKYGLVDWAKAVKEKIITPRHSLDPKATEDDEPLDMDVPIVVKSDFVNDVVYPHAIHTYWFACEGCHEKIFKMAAGQNNMTMSGIAGGNWCGRCHGKVAFPLSDCNRCHTKPKAVAK
ncbi:MAG: cytochrome c3 family protein [Deltaproteobacteria bacterium]|nr:cytochrome c3 family protein [Deltaproteobacteria bacterium]